MPVVEVSSRALVPAENEILFGPFRFQPAQRLLLKANRRLAIGSRELEDPIPSVIAFLQDKRMLIVLDSCEHHVEATAALAGTLLKSAPSVHVLATSREPLRAEGEHLTHLSPLAVPPSSGGLTASDALVYPAVQLFAERAAASVEGFALTDASARVVSDICRRLDGIALAIELAARRVNAFGVHGVATRLGGRFRLLTGGSRRLCRDIRLQARLSTGATSRSRTPSAWSCAALPSSLEAS